MTDADPVVELALDRSNGERYVYVSHDDSLLCLTVEQAADLAGKLSTTVDTARARLLLVAP